MSPTVGQTPDGREVAPGVHRLGSDRVNWYVVEAAGRFTVVDAGFPAHADQLHTFLAARGADLDAVEAVVLTHGHVDHIGLAEPLRREGIAVHAHGADDDLLRSGGGPVPRFFLRNIYRPSVASYLVAGMRAGAGDVEPVGDYEPLADGATLDVPGSPEVLHVPGHSPGQCALFLREHGVLLVGDALATWDLRTGRHTSPRLPAVMDDGRQAFESLKRFERLGEVTLLPGHGNPWEGEAVRAVESAWTSGG